ncbi:MAG: extracellular solute-binding protein [Eubacterium sp.]|nr:extracellular solute-binding protein [Eubacterium sp.]
MRLKRLLASLLSLMFILLTACGNDEIISNEFEQKTEITLSWWGNDTRNEYTLEAVKAFEELHPDIEVKCSYTEWSGYEARNQVRMVSGTEADVMQVNAGWLAQYSEVGTGYYDIESLSEYVSLDNFDADTLDFGRRNGILNAIPIAMNTESIYINKTIYDSYNLPVPETWDDFFEAAKVMKKDGVYPLAGANKSIWLFCIAYTEQKTGKTFFDEKGNIRFSYSEFKTMIEFYNRLVTEKVIPKVEDFQRFNIDNRVYAGTVAWVSDAINYFGTLVEEGDEIIPADYTAFDSSDAGKGWYKKPATLYAISKNTNHPKEAAMLLDFLLNSAEMARLQGLEKGIPVSKAAKRHLEEDGQLTGLQYEASQVMENNSLISPMNSVIENTNLYETFITHSDMVLFDKGTLDDVTIDLVSAYKDSGYKFTKNK